MTAHVDLRRNPAGEGRGSGRTPRRGLSCGVQRGISLGDLRRRSGQSYRELSKITGIELSRTHRIVNGRGRPRTRELAALRQAMLDVIRRQSSSEPDFLRQIQEVAVPFLAGRLRRNALIPEASDGLPGNS